MKTSLKSQITLGVLTAVLSACGGGGENPATNPIANPFSTVYTGPCQSSSDPVMCSFQAGYDQGYAKGYDEGFDEGEEWGYDDGYWDGSNGYGRAINSDEAASATDTNFSAINSEAHQALIKKAAKGLSATYGLSEQKATVVASALATWRVAGVERGYSTPRDVQKTFKKIFGVELADAEMALQKFAAGDSQNLKELTDRSAGYLNLKPHQAQKFIKGMYRDSLSAWGYSDISW